MNKKTCTVCGETKQIADFSSNGKTPKGTPKIKPMCKPCETLGKKTSAKNILSSLVDMKCVRCGYDACVSAIEFHHIDPSTKEFNIGSKRIANVDKIRDEISKCVILCANCHREHHAGMFDVVDLPKATPHQF